MWILLIFLAIPIIEIALFIQVGALIGLAPTLALVLLAAVAGTVLIRVQGFQALGRLRSSLASGGGPVEPIANSALIVAGGILLLIPGFFTDFLGLLLLIPPFRMQIIRWAGDRMAIRGAIFAQSVRRPAPGSRDIVDAEFEVLDDVPPNRRGASGWTRKPN